MKNILGFYPKNIFLYRLAFMHRSVSRVSGSLKSNNERLEYLGDSVISTAVAHYLFKRYPNKDEGFLTEMRSKMVSRATLNKVALKMGLHELLNIDTKSGGYKSVDGNALEALIGAVFLDKGYRFTERVLLRRVIAIHIDMDEIESRDWNYKSKLIDWGQKERFKIHFQVMGALHQKGKKLYKVGAMVNEEVWGEGMDQSIKAAEQIASENAYKNRVLPYIEKQSKKGYRNPLPDVVQVPKPAPRPNPVEEKSAMPAEQAVQNEEQAQNPACVPVVAESAPVYGVSVEATISASLFATDTPRQEEASKPESI
ncbi:MAG: ribonuclease III [Bacteroides sp.]|nr:ribonuclease III [Bacteroides sp.]